MLHDESKKDVSRCMGMLDCLEKELLPATETDRRTVIGKFLRYERGSKTLLEAVTELNQCMLKCRQIGFEANDDVVEFVYKSMLNTQENVHFNSYYTAPDDPKAVAKPTIAAIEALARKQAEVVGRGQSAGISLAANSTHDGKRKPKRAGFKPKGKGGSGGKCTNCTDDNCKGGDQCSAGRMTCFKCGKTGHVKAMCKSKGKGKGDAKANLAGGDEAGF